MSRSAKKPAALSHTGMHGEGRPLDSSSGLVCQEGVRSTSVWLESGPDEEGAWGQDTHTDHEFSRT